MVLYFECFRIYNITFFYFIIRLAENYMYFLTMNIHKFNLFIVILCLALLAKIRDSPAMG